MNSSDSFDDQYRKVMQHRMLFWKQKFDIDEVQVVQSPPSIRQNIKVNHPNEPVSPKKKQPVKNRILQRLHSMLVFF